jgi:poly-gamma-glutamate synthase PgsB/CapB
VAERSLIAQRIAAEELDPDAAPHASLVRERVLAYLPPLQRRLRARFAEQLARRIVLLERSPVPLVEEPLAGQLALLALRVEQVLGQIETEERAAARSFAAFGQMLARAVDPDEKRRVLTEYLVEHATSEQQLRGDLRALDRFLGADALRERHGRAELALSIQSELALLWLEAAFRELATGDHVEIRERIARAELAAALAARLAEGKRWHVRWAAGRALVALLELDPTAGAAARTVIDATGANRDEHPWVQASALEAGVLLEPEAARARLAGRLLAPAAGRDAFVRKRVLQIAVARLAAPVVVSLIDEAVAARDPSEHVRLAIVDTCTKLAWADAVAGLTALTGPEERSVKVRAAGAIAIRKFSTSFSTTHDATTIRQIGELLCRLVFDKATFPAQIACEELAGLGKDLGAGGHALLQELAPRWLAALSERISDPDTSPHVAEAAAAAAEAIERERDPGRRALTRALAAAVGQIRPGQRSTIALEALPPDARAAAADDRTLGRVLADLTRRGWGMSASREAERLRIWRGDRFRRRLWRIVHELRNPLPNKRQAWVHTEEATATAVPGERVNVDAEGSWGRHLPTVDDVLDLPLWRPGEVKVVSSVGTVTLAPPPTLAHRLRNRLLISMRYRRLVALRLASLVARRDPQRRRYMEQLSASYGIAARFEPHPHETPTGVLAPSPADTVDLFESPEARDDAATPSAPTAAALSLGPFTAIASWFDANRAYFSSPTQNSQTALVLFAAMMAAVFWTRGWAKRQQINKARRQIPLSIGGWGTRGKSGTERLKSGLLDGLGFEVFVKTTGCEAMFIHSAPLQQPVEIFIYRPYDKATIWEQMAMLRLGARLKSDVFLWECMALNPKYVQLLQRDWMRDDIVTLTNCYPDHEDIQGPAGFNVANVITEFIPDRSTLITSEQSYLPLFEDICRQRETTMYTVGERESEAIGDDVLDLFPYREHPRNIALVTRVARELEIDPDLAILTMAEHVVPDLGVLKAYPPCRVRGRVLTFLCGNSANERTGFMGNWRRMKLDQLDTEREPHRLVITVVNNRADRIARSEVFARILVRDIDCDKHVLIGTNLKGLRGFIETALDDYLGELRMIEPDELVKGPVPAVVGSRLARELGKFRIARPVVEAAMVRLALYATGAGHAIVPELEPGLRALIAERLGAPGPTTLDDVRRALGADQALTSALEAAVQPMAEPPALGDLPETLEPATRAEALDSFRYELSRMQIRGRLELQLSEVFANPSEAARQRFSREVSAAFRALFLVQVDIIEDSGATGDQIIERCARTVPPGTEVTLMGTQNIKGTGLDFVYRWLALDKVVNALRDQASPRLDKRLAALTELEAFEDHGLVDTGLARALLAREPGHRLTVDESAARARILTKVEAIWTKRRAALVEQRKAGWFERVVGWGEAWVDWLDSARRGRQANRIIDDLVESRISHQRAAVEMRKIVGRIKGGWLVKSLRRRR